MYTAGWAQPAGIWGTDCPPAWRNRQFGWGGIGRVKELEAGLEGDKRPGTFGHPLNTDGYPASQQKKDRHLIV